MKAIKYIAVLVGIAGFIIALGAAGDNAMAIEEMVKRALIGCGMMVVGLFAAGMIDEKENA